MYGRRDLIKLEAKSVFWSTSPIAENSDKASKDGDVTLRNIN